MAAVAKGCVANFSKTLFRSFISNSSVLKSTPKLCFHHSALLYVAGQEIRMPSLSPTMTEGTIVKWLKKEGDPIAPGDVLCEIQTDKAVMSFETEEEGVLAKILLPDDSKDVKVGSLIGLMVAEGEDWKDVEIPSGATAVSSASAAPAASSAPAAAGQASKPSASSGDKVAIKIGPAVRTLLEAYQLAVGDVEGSGPHGMVIKTDVLQFIKDRGLKQKPPKEVSPPVVGKAPSRKAPSAPSPSPTFKPDEGHTDVELSNMRKTIAKRLTQSKTTIPHCYGTVESSIDKVLKLRKVLKADGVSVSVNDFVIKAVAAALQRVPAMNAHYVGDRAVEQTSIDISVAVATPAGLITPIVVGADGLGLEKVSSQVRELAIRAREGRLQPHEFMGGSFTISNLGMFGIGEFSAIINPPQIGILAVGGGRSELDGSGKACTKMSATLSYDRRAVDEATAAEFLEAVRAYLEEPEVLLLGGLGVGQASAQAQKVEAV